MKTIFIRPLEAGDIKEIADAFAKIGWNKPASQYERYLEEQRAGAQVTLAAFADDRFAGYLNVVWETDYAPFREAGIPEIQDFNVLPEFQRQGIGTQLMDEAERLAGERSRWVGIGVGMTADYGAAQQLYVRRGYVPDGRGLCYDGQPLSWGQNVRVDDSLVLHFLKMLHDRE